jgi:hypothetical protein
MVPESPDAAELVANPYTAERSDALVPQPGAVAVYEEHIRALNAGEWEGQLSQFPNSAEVHLKGGEVLRGRGAIGGFIAAGLRPRDAGGVAGLQFTERSRLRVADTLVVHWSADADFLAEPYLGSDAYVTDGRYMISMVTTFDPDGLVFV